ncbi:MAG: glucosyltransferase domain-containing protein [Spirochaetaceae bacterium]|nr:glucosyltransferase domain-containing protein [Spirochaetaceae bacterium]
MESDFTLKGFYEFCRKNKFVLWLSIFSVIATYGIKLANPTVGVDTELYLSNQRFINWLSIGRWALIALQYLWNSFAYGKELYNLYFAIFLACFFLIAGTLSWCYLLNSFSSEVFNEKILCFFAVIFITHQVWAEQIYFTCQAVECILIMCVAPFIVWYLLKGLLLKKYKYIIVGIISSVLCVSVYQGIIVLIFGGLMSGCFCLATLKSANKKECAFLLIRISALMIFALILYFAMNKIILFIFHQHSAEYLKNQAGFGSFTKIKNLGAYFYKLTLGNIGFLNNLLLPIFIANSPHGLSSFYNFQGAAVHANLFLIPAVILFVIKSSIDIRENFFRLIFSLCLVLSVFVFPILSKDGNVPLRSQYIIPFAQAFIFSYLLSVSYKKLTKILWYAVVILTCFYQVISLSMLNYCDVFRYKDDVRLSQAVAENLYKCGVSKDEPVMLYGKHDISNGKGFLRGELLGISSFMYTSEEIFNDVTDRGLAFMKFHGYEFTPATKVECDEARVFADSMEDWPSARSVSNFGSIAVVRFSKTTYKEQ